MPRTQPEINDFPELAPPERISPTPTTLVDGHTVARTTIKSDPLQLKTRLYIQIGELLHQLEGATDEPITVRERIAALVAVGRLQDLLIEKGKDEDEHTGSAVRKYEGVFKKNGAGRRTTIRRGSAGDKLELEPIGGRSHESDADDLDF